MAKLLTYDGQVIDPTACIYIYIYIYVCVCVFLPGPSAESCRGFLLYRFWRILSGIFLEDDFLCTFSHQNEEKKAGDKIRKAIQRLKNRSLRKIRSAKTDPNFVSLTKFWALLRSPNPYNLSEKYWQHTSNLCRRTPPICNAVPCWLLSLEEREKPQYASCLYRSMPPFVPQYASHLYRQ